MDESSDGRVERTFVMEEVKWTARLLPFGEPARYHTLGARIEPPLIGILFTAQGREGFVPMTSDMTPTRFFGLSDDDLRRYCAMEMRERGQAGECIE